MAQGWMAVDSLQKQRSRTAGAGATPIARAPANSLQMQVEG
jgi:hypothetical protein